MGSKANGQSVHLDITDRLTSASQREKHPALLPRLISQPVVRVMRGASHRLGLLQCVCVCVRDVRFSWSFVLFVFLFVFFICLSVFLR